MTYVLDWRTQNPDLRAVADAIQRGELVVLPTDSCYGLACDAFDSDAVGRLRQARGMLEEPLLAVLVAGMGVVRALAAELPGHAQALADAYWPGPISMILPARSSLDWELGAPASAVALRIPAQKEVLALLQLSGPLAVSQASPVGHPPPYSVEDALEELPTGVALAVDAGALPVRSLSTFVDCRGEDLVILREGPIKASELLETVNAATTVERAQQDPDDLDTSH